MPAAAVIPAIAGIVGTGASALSQRSAGKAQERANQQAIAEERRREAQGEARRKEALDIYRNNWQTWFKRYGKKGIDRYGMPSGIDVTKLRAPGSAPAVPGATPGGAPMAGPRGSSNVAALMREGGQQRAAGAMKTGNTLGSMLQQAGQGVSAALQARPGAVGGFGGTGFDPSKLRFDPRGSGYRR